MTFTKYMQFSTAKESQKYDISSLFAIQNVYLQQNLKIMEAEKEKKERTVIHVHLKESDTHHYFGSIANIYENLSVDEVGITYGSLRNYGLSQEKAYENAKCIIRKGILLSKSGNRGRKAN